jgi:hypothetical protein
MNAACTPLTPASDPVAPAQASPAERRRTMTHVRRAIPTGTAVVALLLGSLVLAYDHDPLIQDLVDGVSRDRLLEIVEHLESYGTRFSPSAGIDQAVEWAAAEFAGLGLDTEIQLFNDTYPGNVIALQQGWLHPDRYLVLGAHLDSVSDVWGVAPGADDNASGCALVLHAAEMLTQHAFEDSIIYALWAVEETYRWGSVSWAEAADLNDDEITAYLNFDMVGYADALPEDLDLIVNTPSQSLGQEYIDISQLYLDHPITMTLDDDSNLSDYFSFWSRDFVALACFEDEPITNPYYHTENDRSSTMDFGFLEANTKATVAFAAQKSAPVQQLSVRSFWFDDTSGDGDGVVDPGETVGVVIELFNWDLQAASDVHAVVTLESGATWIRILDDTAQFGVIAPGGSADNADHPFRMAVSYLAPEETLAVFSVESHGAAGPVFESKFQTVVRAADYVPELYRWDMEERPEWQYEGEWEWGVPQGESGTHGSPDPTSGYTGNNVIGYNLEGGYESSMPAMALITQPLDLSSVYHAAVTFHRWLGIGQTGSANAAIYASPDGVDFRKIWEPYRSFSDESWKRISFALDASFDLQPHVVLKWVMGPVDSERTFCGWNLDDISISGYRLTHAPLTEPAVRIALASPYVSPGDPFYVAGFLDNPGDPLTDAPVFFLLDIAGEFWFWPSWVEFDPANPESIDYEQLDVPNGTSYVEVIPRITWPDTGSAGMTGIRFWGAILNASRSQILGQFAVVEWGFGPES